VKDHCHITGKYQGAAHNDCNLKLPIKPKTVPKPMSQVQGEISCIPNNTEKYVSFSLGNLGSSTA